MEIRKLHSDEYSAALALIWETFLRFEAPDYPPEGVQSFKSFIDDPKQVASLEIFGALEEEMMLGVLAVSGNRKDICCFFVQADRQRQGIGRKLWEYLLANSENVPIYHKLGFVDTDTERVEDGIRYTPMKYTR